MDIFEINYNRLMKMSKRQIALESVERGFLSPRSVDYKIRTWSKILMARELADRIERKELRGY